MLKRIAVFVLLTALLMTAACKYEAAPEPETPSRDFETVVEKAPEYCWEIEIDDSASQVIAEGVTVQYSLKLSLKKNSGTYADGAYIGSYQFSYAIDAGDYVPMLKLVGFKNEDLNGTAHNDHASFEYVPFSTEALDRFGNENDIETVYISSDSSYAMMCFGTTLTFTESDLGILSDEKAAGKLETLGILQGNMKDAFNLFQGDKMMVPYLLTQHNNGKARMTFFLFGERIVFTGELVKTKISS